MSTENPVNSESCLAGRLLSVCVALFGMLCAVGILEIAFRFKSAPKPTNFEPERPDYFYLPSDAHNKRGNSDGALSQKRDFRVVVIGDSFTFGPGMQYDDVFSKRLERMFRQNTGAQNVDVVNLGTPGYSTIHELTMVSRALALKPDVVLLEVTLNDPQLRELQKEPEEIRGQFGPYKPSGFFAPLIRSSRFLSWVGARIHNQRSVQAYIDYHNRLWTSSETLNPFRTAFAEMRKQLKDAGVKFGVVLFPLFDFPLDARYPFRDLHRIVQREVAGTPFIDLFERFRRLDPYRLQLMPGRDTHPNEIAHRLASEAVYTFMVKSGFVPQKFQMQQVLDSRSELHEVGAPKE